MVNLNISLIGSKKVIRSPQAPLPVGSITIVREVNYGNGTAFNMGGQLILGEQISGSTPASLVAATMRVSTPLSPWRLNISLMLYHVFVHYHPRATLQSQVIIVEESYFIH